MVAGLVSLWLAGSPLPCPPLELLCSWSVKAHLPCWLRPHSRDPYFSFISSVRHLLSTYSAFLSTGDQSFNLQVLGCGRTQFSSFTRMSQSLPWHCWAVWRLPRKTQVRPFQDEQGSCEVAQRSVLTALGLGLVLKHHLWLPYDLSVHTQTCESEWCV